MKIPLCLRKVSLPIGCGLALLLSPPIPVEASLLPVQPMIQSITVEGPTVVVEALVSGGARKVTLESRSRLGGGAWEPRAVLRLDPASTPARTVTFKVDKSARMEVLRVRADDNETLPLAFYKGTNSFGVPSASGGPPVPSQAPGTDAAIGGGGETKREATSPDRAVVESDIWKLEGDTLYFFNQYRGLQIVDVSQPDSPSILGVYELPASGEQMYVLDQDRVVLMARDNCNGWGNASQSQIMLLDAKDGQPKLVAQLPVKGYIRESRLVGSVLYVVSESYLPVRVENPEPPKDGGIAVPAEVWEWGNEISSFDLAQFSDPVARSRAWVPGYGNAIQATDRFLFVATIGDRFNDGGNRSNIRVFDISSPEGVMSEMSTLRTAGWVKDKFKMDLAGDTLRVVTETFGENWKTQVETFSLADPKAPVRLALLNIIEREQLHATRFAGHLLYAVTFMRVDPLWIIDLSDPKNPKKMGELEIPGWSTFIYPWGDRLVTVGIDNTEGWRTAVQLFDVSDPSKPTLASKVILGEQYSSSEANQDEKAFGVLPENNLILIPYSTWKDGNSLDGVHLIDLTKEKLQKRGSIPHTFQARRATLHRDRILSLSGVELLTVDATNRDEPKVISSTELSWSVDRVFVEDQYLIQISSPWNVAPAIRIVATDAPDRVLNVMKLPNLPLLGATVRDRQLFVLQGRSTEVIWPREWTPENYAPIATNQANLTLSVINLSALPAISLAGKTETPFENQYWGNFQPLWPRPGVLVWNTSQSGGRFPRPWLDIRGGPGIASDALVADKRIAPWFWWGSSQCHLVAHDVAAASPAFLSHVKLDGNGNWWNFSPAHTVGGLIYLSHEVSEFHPEVIGPPILTQTWDGNKYITSVIQPDPGAWLQRFYLNVVNYADAKEPSVRKPVNIPGSLIGIAHQGALLYTQGYRYANPEKWADYSEWLDASAYDGVEARLVTSMPLGGWPRPTLVLGNQLLLGRPAQDGQKDALQLWSVSDAGKFTLEQSTPLKASAQYLRLINGLLAVQLGNEVELFDAANPSDLRPLITKAPGGCLWYTLENGDGSLEEGLWLPLNAYGAAHLPIHNAPSTP